MFPHIWSSDEVHEGDGPGFCVIICQSLRDQTDIMSQRSAFFKYFTVHICKALILQGIKQKQCSCFLSDTLQINSDIKLIFSKYLTNFGVNILLINVFYFTDCCCFSDI